MTGRLYRTARIRYNSAMRSHVSIRKRVAALWLAALLLVCCAPASASAALRAASTATGQTVATGASAAMAQAVAAFYGDHSATSLRDDADPDKVPVEGNNLAATAARLLRGDENSEEYKFWRTTMAHDPSVDPAIADSPYTVKPVVKVARNVLSSMAGYSIHLPQSGPIVFVPCGEVTLPADDIEIASGEEYNLHGTIYTELPLESVAVTIQHKSSSNSLYPYKKVATFDKAANVTAYSLDNDNNIEGESLSARVRFSQFLLGRHRITITARVAGMDAVEVYSGDFTISKIRPVQLTPNRFSDNFQQTYEFFGRDAQQFLFTYTWRKDRSISTATKWREASLVEDGFLRDRVHSAALPYFDEVTALLTSGYVRVSGNGRDSKVIQLKKLATTVGTYVPRFQNNERYISHHTLGTCADVNQYIYPNKDILTNHDLIGTDVRDNLVYNGILTDGNGQQYYDFTYTGNYKARTKGVPNTLLNYLLYELAFFRAGFSWGFYYETSCDAMHFTLTDSQHFWKHSDKTYGLRKVFDYYN